MKYYVSTKRGRLVVALAGLALLATLGGFAIYYVWAKPPMLVSFLWGGTVGVCLLSALWIAITSREYPGRPPRE